MKPRGKILIVDDNPTNIMILEKILKADYDFLSATSGEDALAKAPTFQPDLILLDIMMPGMNGYDVCRHIRENQALQYTKIIMVSAKAMTSERLKGYDAGADDYLVKPFEEEELRAKVRVYLRLKSTEEVNQLKTHVLALINHEMRTPLNGILGPAEMLLSTEVLTAEERRSMLEMIHESARYLNAFFEKAVTLSALKSGNYPLHGVPTDLGALAREAVEEVIARTKERKVSVHLTLPDATPVSVDREQIKRVLSILLDNAVRFSAVGGEVSVTLASEETTVRLAVSDQGEGIDPGFMAHLFNGFVDGDLSHHTSGQGLSLAIAHQIVLGHRGQLRVESVPGAGTTFFVDLPVSCPAEELVTA